MKTTKSRRSLRSAILITVILLLSNGAYAQSLWTEAWNSSSVGNYAFDANGEALVSGDVGAWLVVDAAGEPTGNQVEIESVGGNKRLKLTCLRGGALQASISSLNLPVVPGTRLAVTETGSLLSPYWNGAFPTVFPPPGDNVHLTLEDNLGNKLVYIFQRAGNYPAHTTALAYSNTVTGQIENLGYREVFVDNYDSSGGTYLLDLFSDFSAVPGFVASGASIRFIEFMAAGTASGTTVATMDDLKIGTGVTGSLPNVTILPQAQTVHYGENAFFQAETGGTSPFTYQWRTNGVNIIGANQRTLQLSNVTEADQDSYTVLVSNQFGSVTSQVATLTVDPRPYILQQPLSQLVENGDAVTINVSAGGAPEIDYQWQKDGKVLPGQTGSYLSIPSATVGDSGTYSVTVSNSYDTVQSAGAELTVAPPLTLGDAVDAPFLAWTNGGDLGWLPQRTTTFDGEDALETGPVEAFKPQAQSAWLQTEVSGPGILSFRWRLEGQYANVTLALLVNDSVKIRITGGRDWQEMKVPIGAGQQRIRWSFDVGPYTDPVLDRAWLDQVRILPRATSTTFANTNTIEFPYGIGVNGNPYPSVINVSGMTNEVTEVVVHLSGLTMDTDASGLDLLLVAPSGEKSLLLSDAALPFGVSKVDLQIDDMAIQALPKDSSFNSGVYLPTDYVSSGAFPADSFPAPAPAGPWPHSLSVFEGASPNGTWRLFSRNESVFGGFGELAGGWSLDLLTRKDVFHLENARVLGSEIQFVVTGPPEAGFLVEATSNMIDWEPVFTNSIPAQGWYPFYNDNSAGLVGRFYRISEVQPSPPTITSQPQNQTVLGGTTVSLTVVAASAWPMNYQWQKNGVAISGATNATLTIYNAQTGNNGSYSVVVGNVHGSVASSDATLTVQTPINDAFANRLEIAGMTNTTSGSNLGATKEPGEPDHAGNSGGKSVWWTWTAPMDGTVTMDTLGSSFDTLLAVYTGTSVSILSPVSSVHASGSTSNLTFVAAAGTTYQIAVDGFDEASGAIVLNVAEQPPSPPAITGQPESKTVAAGATVMFTVVANSPWPLSYQWLKNDVPIGGATMASLTLPNVQTTNSGIYNVHVSNAYATTTSSTATLTVVLVSNDAFADRLTITGISNSVTGSNLGATKEAGEPDHAGNAGGKSVWWTWTAPIDGTVTIDTIGSSFDTLLAAYVGTSISGLTLIASDDDSGPSGTSQIALAGVAGTAYEIAVDGYGGDSGDIVVNVREVPYQQPPPNDQFANRISIEGLTNTVSGSNEAATKELGEPDHAGNAGGGSVWWTWTAPTNGPAIVDTIGSSFDTLLAVYTGTSVSNLSLVASNDNIPFDQSSQVGFAATAGTVYQIAVDGYDGDSGNILLHVASHSGPPNDLFATRIPIVGLPARVTGSNVGATSEPLEPYIGGIPDGPSVWWTWAAPTNGAVKIDTIGSSFPTKLGVFRGSYVDSLYEIGFDPHSNSDGTSKGLFPVNAGWNYEIAVSADNGASGSIVLTLDLAPIVYTPYTITTLAGGSLGSADGVGGGAQFNHPEDVAVDSVGNVYVADADNDTIRKVTSAGVVTTLAGLAGNAGSSDGMGTDARFASPSGIAVDSAGNVFVADTGNDTIRKVTSAGVVTTLAGLAGSSGTDDGMGSAARFDRPSGVAVDSTGNVYVADTYNQTVRKVTSAGVVTTLVGLAGNAGSSDGMGTDARFTSPSGIAVDSDGNVFVADTGNDTIRKVTPIGVVTTLAGLARTSGYDDGTGSAARFYFPYGVAVDGVGNVYVADTSNYTIRKVTPAGVVTTLAGLPGSVHDRDGTGSAAGFRHPTGVALDSVGNIYVADSYKSAIRKGVSANAP